MAGNGRFLNSGERFSNNFGYFHMNQASKRKRINTGGESYFGEMNGHTYADATNLGVSQMSDSDKLNLLLSKICHVDSLTSKVDHALSLLSDAYKEIDQMKTQMVILQERAESAECRIIDLEARSRRNNLIFTNIPEPDLETNEQCEATLIDFLKNYMKLGDNVNDIVFHRVHRLGVRKPGVAPNGQPWKPRSVIAGFRDFKAKQFVLNSAKNLKGLPHSIHEDYPQEIRSARGKLWPDFTTAKANNQRAKLVYPAKLIVNGHVERDELPGWNQKLRRPLIS